MTKFSITLFAVMLSVILYLLNINVYLAMIPLYIDALLMVAAYFGKRKIKEALKTLSRMTRIEQQMATKMHEDVNIPFAKRFKMKMAMKEWIKRKQKTGVPKMENPPPPPPKKEIKSEDHIKVVK